MLVSNNLLFYLFSLLINFKGVINFFDFFFFLRFFFFSLIKNYYNYYNNFCFFFAKFLSDSLEFSFNCFFLKYNFFLNFFFKNNIDTFKIYCYGISYLISGKNIKSFDLSELLFFFFKFFLIRKFYFFSNHSNFFFLPILEFIVINNLKKYISFNFFYNNKIYFLNDLFFLFNYCDCFFFFKKKNFFFKKKYTNSFLDWKLKNEINLLNLNINYLKIIISRKKNFFFLNNYNVFFLLFKIYRKNINTNIYFLFSGLTNFCFLSISPEKLLYFKNGFFFLESVAGTSGFYKNKKFEISNSLFFLKSYKDYIEHNFVVTYLLLIGYFLFGNIFIMKFNFFLNYGKIKHFITNFLCKIFYKINIFYFISNISPTPAILGIKKKKSFFYLKKVENFNRNFYCGVIGYISSTVKYLIISIRSVFVFFNLVILYSGAGMISYSLIKNETIEINNKISRFLFFL